MNALTPRQIDQRIIKGRRALARWSRTDDEINRVLIDTEIEVLKGLLVIAPEEKTAKIRALIERYQVDPSKLPPC